MATLRDVVANNTLSQVKASYLEIISFGSKFNLVLLYEDDRVENIEGIDKTKLEKIKEQLSCYNIQHTEGLPLNWTNIMETVRESPEEFHGAGGWESLQHPTSMRPVSLLFLLPEEGKIVTIT